MTKKPADLLPGQSLPDFAGFRAQFPAASANLYLDVADRGLVSIEVRKAVSSFLNSCAEGNSKDLARSWVDLARQRFAQFVHAQEHEIALVKNVSDGVNTVANAIDWKPGDNVVLCEELEHPSNLYPWYSVRERCGITIRRVEAESWSIDPKRITAAIDARTRMVAASMVTFAPGFRTGVEEIARECRARGVLFIADAAQAVGVLDVDVNRLSVDALVVGTSKALLGFYGMGFLYVRQTAADLMRPVYLSGQGVNRSSPYDSTMSPLKPGAARFEVGNQNHVGCVAAAVSIAQLQILSPTLIEQRSIDLAKMLSDGFKERGLPVMEAPTSQGRTNIVAVGSTLEPGLDTTTDPVLLSLYKYLSTRRVHLSIRRGVLRLSVHAYTSRDDILQVLELVSGWQRSTSAGALSVS